MNKYMKSKYKNDEEYANKERARTILAYHKKKETKDLLIPNS